MHGYRSTMHGPRSTRHGSRSIGRASEHEAHERAASIGARGAEHELVRGVQGRGRGAQSTRRRARGAERARGEEHEALSAKCGAEEHGARGMEHEARSTKHGARGTGRRARHEAQSARRRARARRGARCMNGVPQNARSKTRGHFFSESVHFAKDFPKKFTPFGSR